MPAAAPTGLPPASARVQTPSQGSRRVRPRPYTCAQLSTEPIDDMGAFAVYAFLTVTPAVAFWAFVKGFEWLARYEPALRAPVPAGRSIERLVDDLRRLGDEQRRVRCGDAPARRARLESLMLAYDDTLVAACAAVGAPHVNRPPLEQSVRLEMELALTARGVVW